MDSNASIDTTDPDSQTSSRTDQSSSRHSLPRPFPRSTVNLPSITASARNNGDHEGGPSSSPSSSSSSSSPSSRRSDSSPKASSSAYVGAGTSTAAILYTTSQEFGVIWNQTTAFLHRTFSPTYRVSGLYLDSWTNGTQRRGLERLKSNVMRGDAFVLVRNMTLQLKDLLKRSIAETANIERHSRAIEEKKGQSRGQGQAAGSNGKGGRPSSNTSDGDHDGDNSRGKSGNSSGAGDETTRNQ
ncbi:hypothetical protein BC939DRAFT_457917 [Gamsiella multidivaricata]|uniref:uncharacterized protein n=1 Tax=Gamsiella multidivaricata TaxID=101098 RepID=UPI00221FD8B7|nr:uncharacterized protein BC939DRAFT_457917 [Gamsiella multidivaricata]KAI7820415.1 hypothetical protein BC939DRAFT_457917 [Gamsiella multidivaricata]